MRFRAAGLLVLLAATAVHAQQNLPDLSTVTQATALPTTATGNTDSTSATSGSATDSTSSGTSTGGSTTGATTGSTSATTPALTATFPDAVTSSTTGDAGGGTPFSLTGLPTIAGAGIPTMIVPFTANAPFMQKSSMPEGTVFIAVGAVLAFLGATVLLWRGMVAWSINRSVKRRSALDMTGSEKSSRWGGGGGGSGNKSAYSKEYDMGSSMSLDALTSSGKPIRNSTFPEENKRQTTAPPAGLFFSPTAHVSNRASSANLDQNRSSSYLPAGYYASPSAEAGAGRNSTTIGGSLAPYARNSTVNPSPPNSPGLPNSRSTSNYYSSAAGHPTSRDGLRNGSREGLRAPPSRDGYSSQRNSGVLYTQPSNSSLMVGTGAGNTRASSEYLGGQRAPSAVLDELFENHGNGPRERF